MTKRVFAVTAAMLTAAPSVLATQSNWHPTAGMSGSHDSSFPKPIYGPRD